MSALELNCSFFGKIKQDSNLDFTGKHYKGHLYKKPTLAGDIIPQGEYNCLVKLLLQGMQQTDTDSIKLEDICFGCARYISISLTEQEK